MLSPVPPLGFGLGPGEDGRVLAEGDAGDLEEGEQVRAVLVPVRQARQLHQPWQEIGEPVREKTALLTNI